MSSAFWFICFMVALVSLLGLICFIVYVDCHETVAAMRAIAAARAAMPKRIATDADIEYALEGRGSDRSYRMAQELHQWHQWSARQREEETR